MSGGSCSFWLRKKNRYCKHHVVDLKTEFCPLHCSEAKNEAADRLRVPCPLDSSHTIYEDQVKKHVKKCPAGKILAHQEAQPFFMSAINSFSQSNNEVSCCSFSQDDLVLRVINWWKTSKHSNSPSIDHVGNEKHEIQLKSIVEMVGKYILEEEFTQETIGVEMGAGKGTLSAALHIEYPNWNHLLVDIQKNFRNKAERKLFQDKSEEKKFKRIHIDIADLHLEKALEDQFPGLSENCNVILYAKHLCGLALDLALNCLVNTISTHKISLVTFATCCHHRCKWEQYCNISFLQETLGSCTREEFASICSMTSWSSSQNQMIYCWEQSATSNEEQRNLQEITREEIGIMCKYLLDEGRVCFLDSAGFSNPEIIEYVTRDITPENRLLLYSRSE